MALSNIFREPRREITETVVGIALFAGFGVPDYFLVAYMYAHDTSKYLPPFLVYLLVMTFFVAAAVAAVVGVAFGIHAIGEVACNALDRRGIHLRPRRD